jgi:hypothetical protein
MPIGQLILPCQHPRNATTAAPARLLATSPGHHQLYFFSFTGFPCSTASVITSPGCFLGLLLNHRMNRDQGQNQKGRISGVLTLAAQGAVPEPQKDVY